MIVVRADTRHFWKTTAKVLLSFGTLALTTACLYLPSRPLRTAPVPPALPAPPNPAPAATTQAAPLPRQEVWIDDKPSRRKLIEVRRFRIGRDRWRAETWESGVITHYVRLFRNGKRVQRINAAEMDCATIGVKRIYPPAPYPVLAVRAHTGAGHGQLTRFYAVWGGRLKKMGEVNGECGGPVFRDFDGDGVQEWVFDDDDWYTYDVQGPGQYRVYKIGKSGKLRLWKRLPNRQRKRLPDTVGLAIG